MKTSGIITTRNRFAQLAVIMIVLAGLMLAGTAQATVNTAVADGDWEAGGTWSEGVAPQATHDVVIPTNITVTINGLNTIAINSLTITGMLTHAANVDTEANKIILDVETDVIIAVGGAIDVSEMGYALQQGDGKPVPSNCRGGAGHGGEGGWGYNSTARGASYGSYTNPVRLGSGSVNYSGGGAVILTAAGAITLNGSIEADGGSATSTVKFGGASGGSVNVSAASLAGSGTIMARGGNSYDNSGGGGGGRIAVIVTN